MSMIMRVTSELSSDFRTCLSLLSTVAQEGVRLPAKPHLFGCGPGGSGGPTLHQRTRRLSSRNADGVGMMPRCNCVLVRSMQSCKHLLPIILSLFCFCLEYLLESRSSFISLPIASWSQRPVSCGRVRPPTKRPESDASLIIDGPIDTPEASYNLSQCKKSQVLSSWQRQCA